MRILRAGAISLLSLSLMAPAFSQAAPSIPPLTTQAAQPMALPPLGLQDAKPLALPPIRDAAPATAPVPSAPVAGMPPASGPSVVPGTPTFTLPASASVAVPAATPTEETPPKSEAAAPETPAEEAPLKFVAITPDKPAKKGLSLMFNATDLARLNQVIQAYDLGFKVDIAATGTGSANPNQDPNQPEGEQTKEEVLNQILDDLGAEVAAEQPKFFPNFYVSSIIYHGENDWAVWINGLKVTPKRNKPERPLTVVSVSPSEVVLNWKPVGSILPTLLATLQTDAKADSGRDAISVSDNKIFVLHLRPNQTFVSGSVTIREGRYMNSKTPDLAMAAQPGQPQTQIEEVFPESAPLPMSLTGEGLSKAQIEQLKNQRVPPEIRAKLGIGMP